MISIKTRLPLPILTGSILLAATGLFATAAQADAIAKLNTFLESSRSMRAEFQQIIVGKSARKPQETSGTMEIQRPGKFRWEVKKPYPQLIVGNGENIWLYDPELKQVTIKKSSPTLGATPAALLAADRGQATLEKSFTLKNTGEKNGLDWLEAIPKTTDTGFERIRIGFFGSDPVAMELTDAFSQITHLRFLHIERNPALNAEQFKFVPPAGVDIVGE